MLFEIQYNARIHILIYTNSQLIQNKNELDKDIHNNKLTETKQIDLVYKCQFFKNVLRGNLFRLGHMCRWFALGIPGTLWRHISRLMVLYSRIEFILEWVHRQFPNWHSAHLSQRLCPLLLPRVDVLSILVAEHDSSILSIAVYLKINKISLWCFFILL